MFLSFNFYSLDSNRLIFWGDFYLLLSSHLFLVVKTLWWWSCSFNTCFTYSPVLYLPFVFSSPFFSIGYWSIFLVPTLVVEMCWKLLLLSLNRLKFIWCQNNVGGYFDIWVCIWPGKMQFSVWPQSLTFGRTFLCIEIFRDA